MSTTRSRWTKPSSFRRRGGVTTWKKGSGPEVLLKAALVMGVKDGEWEVSLSRIGDRVDKFLAEAMKATRGQIQTLQIRGSVLVNGVPVKDHYRLRAGDRVQVTESPDLPLDSSVGPEKIKIVVRYEDADVMVIDKPVGMVVHPGAGVKSGTLVNALLGRGGPLSTIGGPFRPGIVHRLDKDTSGLLIVAKTNVAHSHFLEQLLTRTLHRVYAVLVHGDVQPPSGVIDQPIIRHAVHRQKFTVIKSFLYSPAHLSRREKNQRSVTGREARTRYEAVERFGVATFLRVELETGRTHQIRVHMQSLKHPVVGDLVYGGRKVVVPGVEMSRQALHAHRLGFIHPVSGKTMEVESPLPKDLEKVLKGLRGWVNQK